MCVFGLVRPSLPFRLVFFARAADTYSYVSRSNLPISRPSSFIYYISRIKYQNRGIIDQFPKKRQIFRGKVFVSGLELVTCHMQGFDRCSVSVTAVLNA